MSGNTSGRDRYAGNDESPAPIVVIDEPATFGPSNEAGSARTTLTGFESSENVTVWELSRKVFDNICFLFFCPEHRKMLLNESGTVTSASSGKTLKFFPYVMLPRSKKWYVTAMEGANSILSDIRPALLRRIATGEGASSSNSKLRDAAFSRFECIHIFRFQLPFSQHFLTRLIYLGLMKPAEAQDDRCCQNGSQCRWFSLDDVIEGKLTKVWGPEVGYFASYLDSLINNASGFVGITEYSMAEARKYQAATEIGSATTGALNHEEVMLAGAGVSNSDIERLYADFIEHSFPSFFMTSDSFELFMAKRHEIETDWRKLKRYFHAFRTRGKPYMQFHELLLGLASIDPRTMHGEVRVKMVFRYYDADKDDHLNLREFTRLYKDMQVKRSSMDNEDRQIRTDMQNIGAVLVEGQLAVPLIAFKRAVGAHMFRGTSRLCRVAHSPFAIISQSLVNRKLVWGGFDPKDKIDVLRNQKYEGVCPGCRAGPQYELSTTVVYIDDKSGRLVRAEAINTTIANFVAGNVHSSRYNGRRKAGRSPGSNMPRQYSLDITFNKTLVLHFLMDKIREFNKVKGSVRAYRGLMGGAKDNELYDFMNDVGDICKEMASLLESEDRCLRINDPCYVIGDLHGNLEDLLSLEDVLWRRAPLLDANYLFLGDYVDRGRWGFEVFIYLMCLKLLSPTRVFLLRGNHEVRHIQIKYTFHKELVKKYGKDTGPKLFDMLNAVFDRLPCCSVIDDSIYCSHGGIPYSQLDLAAINAQTPKVLAEPEIDAPAVWELIWSDPIENERFSEMADLLGIPENTYGGGFLPNLKRGTSVVFNARAIELFLSINNLRSIIRAHEVPAPGFRFNFGMSCLTIFSCSHYCGADNEASVILADREGRLRIIRIDTSANNPCTDRNAD